MVYFCYIYGNLKSSGILLPNPKIVPISETDMLRCCADSCEMNDSSST